MHNAPPPKKAGGATQQRRIYPGMADQSFDSTQMSNQDNYYHSSGAGQQHQVKQTNQSFNNMFPATD